MATLATSWPQLATLSKEEDGDFEEHHHALNFQRAHFCSHFLRPLEWVQIDPSATPICIRIVLLRVEVCLGA